MWRNKSSKSTHCFVKHFPVHMEPRECQQVSRGTSDATTLSSLIDCCCGYCSFGVSPPLTSTAGYIRCGTHLSLLSSSMLLLLLLSVIWSLSNLKTRDFRHSKITQDGRTDRRTDGWMDMTSYRDTWTHLKTAILVVQK